MLGGMSALIGLDVVPTFNDSRRIVAGLFFGTLVPLIYFYLQHKVHRVPGCEWLTSPSGIRWKI